MFSYFTIAVFEFNRLSSKQLTVKMIFSSNANVFFKIQMFYCCGIAIWGIHSLIWKANRKNVICWSHDEMKRIVFQNEHFTLHGWNNEVEQDNKCLILKAHKYSNNGQRELCYATILSLSLDVFYMTFSFLLLPNALAS